MLLQSRFFNWRIQYGKRPFMKNDALFISQNFISLHRKIWLKCCTLALKNTVLESQLGSRQLQLFFSSVGEREKFSISGMYGEEWMGGRNKSQPKQKTNIVAKGIHNAGSTIDACMFILLQSLRKAGESFRAPHVCRLPYRRAESLAGWFLPLFH